MWVGAFCLMQGRHIFQPTSMHLPYIRQKAPYLAPALIFNPSQYANLASGETPLPYTSPHFQPTSMCLPCIRQNAPTLHQPSMRLPYTRQKGPTLHQPSCSTHLHTPTLHQAKRPYLTPALIFSPPQCTYLTSGKTPLPYTSRHFQPTSTCLPYIRQNAPTLHQPSF